jgi:hypothetical protein
MNEGFKKLITDSEAAIEEGKIKIDWGLMARRYRSKPKHG